jgi:hypothetical protein
VVADDGRVDKAAQIGSSFAPFFFLCTLLYLGRGFKLPGEGLVHF